MKNANASKVDHQTLADGEIQKEHSDEVAETVCGDSKQVQGGYL